MPIKPEDASADYFSMGQSKSEGLYRPPEVSYRCSVYYFKAKRPRVGYYVVAAANENKAEAALLRASPKVTGHFHKPGTVATPFTEGVIDKEDIAWAVLVEGAIVIYVPFDRGWEHICKQPKGYIENWMKAHPIACVDARRAIR
jgi:hypothetical protein